MIEKIEKKKQTSRTEVESDSSSRLLIFLCWLVYMVSYFGKVNYSANITQIIDYYQITKPQAGIAPTFFFFAYGIGQVVNGLLCKKYNMKKMIFLALFTSAVLNLIVAITKNFSIIKWLWLINGFVLSILWPTLIRLLSEVLPEIIMGKAVVTMGTTVAFGTLITYGCSSFFAIFNQFRLAFYLAAGIGIVVSIIWFSTYNKAVSNVAREEPIIEVKVEEAISMQQRKQKMPLYYICILSFFAIGCNLIKDGLIIWVPSVLKEEFKLVDSLSILLTLALPIVSLFGSIFALKIHKKVHDYIVHGALLFFGIGCMIIFVIGSIHIHILLLILIGLTTACFLASSLNSLLTNVFPMYTRKVGNAGLYAGVLNGFCYLGSTISSYGLAVIAETWNWTAVFVSLLLFCIVVFFIWLGYYYIKMIISKKKNKGKESRKEVM